MIDRRTAGTPPWFEDGAMTFGGEVESLIVDPDGHLAPLMPELREQIDAVIGAECRQQGLIGIDPPPARTSAGTR